MSGGVDLPFFVRYQYPSLTATATLSSEGDRENGIVELAMWENGKWWIYSNTFKLLPLSLIDCHNRRDCVRKSSTAQFEVNGRI